MEGKFRNTHWSFRKSQDLYQERGLGITTEGGSLGHTYGQRGFNVFRRFSFYLTKWTFTLRFDWKSFKGWED